MKFAKVAAAATAAAAAASAAAWRIGDGGGGGVISAEQKVWTVEGGALTNANISTGTVDSVSVNTERPLSPPPAAAAAASSLLTAAAIPQSREDTWTGWRCW